MPKQGKGNLRYMDKQVQAWEEMADPSSHTNTFEFWPAWTIHIPMVLSGAYYAIKSLDLGFFALLNPAMGNGGLYHYSKNDIMEQLANINKPKTLCFQLPTPVEMLGKNIDLAGISFPMICKPDRGERGRGVELINSQGDLTKYLNTQMPGNYLAQELLVEREEYGVFYVHDPATGQPTILSLAKKIPLQVVGDGRQRIKDLVLQHPRAKRYLKEIPDEFLERIPIDNELVKLSKMGNHCRGAVFLDYNRAIDDKLANTFHSICGNIRGFHYGRLDVKVDKLEDLWDVSKIRVVEINGANSEAAHIYSPGNGYFKAISNIVVNFRIMYKIATFNKTQGVSKPKLSKLWSNFISSRERA